MDQPPSHVQATQEELKTDELPLEATYAAIEWKKENVENDAAALPSDEGASPEKT